MPLSNPSFARPKGLCEPCLPAVVPAGSLRSGPQPPALPAATSRKHLPYFVITNSQRPCFLLHVSLMSVNRNGHTQQRHRNHCYYGGLGGGSATSFFSLFPRRKVFSYVCWGRLTSFFFSLSVCLVRNIAEYAMFLLFLGTLVVARIQVCEKLSITKEGKEGKEG